MSTAWAQSSQSNLSVLVPKQFPAPLLLTDEYPIPETAEFISAPPPPGEGPDGSSWNMRASIVIPDAFIMDRLSGEAFIPALRNFNRRERQPNKYYWHTTTGGWAFSHYRDFEGNHWYGWDDGSKFFWALWRKGHFWWKDTLSKRWLYFHAGYWWWPDPQEKEFIRVYYEGSYFICDAKGNVLSSEGERPGEFRSKWKGAFQGDFVSRGTGGHNRGNSGRPGSQGHPNGVHHFIHGSNATQDQGLAVANK